VLSTNPSYGHRRIAMALKVGRKRVRRVMRLYSIKPYKRKARWRKRRDERRPEAEYQNLIKGICPLRPGVVFVGDFTYLRWKGRFVYLATFMDLFTREIVGWNVSTKHTKEFVLEAFWDAVMGSRLPRIVHTDQGTEYCSKEYTEFMERLNIQISMSKKSSPWENGYQESFYNNFKTDLGLEFERFNTPGELIEGIHQTINYYNNQRIHTTLKMPPTAFKHKHLY
jgi:putative transposase